MFVWSRVALFLICLTVSVTPSWSQESDDEIAKYRYDELENTQKRIDELEKNLRGQTTFTRVHVEPKEEIYQPFTPTTTETISAPSYRSTDPEPIYLDPEHQFEIAADSFVSHNKEPERVIRRNSLFGGLAAGYTYRPDQDIWLDVYHFDIRGDYGKVSYKTEETKLKHISNYEFEGALWAGKDLNINAGARLTPYLGIGYWWLDEQLKRHFSDDFEVGGFSKQTQYLYIPAGLTMTLRPITGWRADFNGEYDYLLWGRVTSDLTDVHPAFNEISNRLRSGYGLRGSIKLVKEGDRVNYFLRPYYRYWKVNDSNSVSVSFLGIPLGDSQEFENHTTEVGLQLGAEF